MDRHAEWVDVTSLLDLVPRDGLMGPVRCGDADHLIAWTGSGLSARGHDATEEDILGALGGQRPPCVQLATTWDEYKLEPLLLGALLTGRSDLLARQSQATVGPPVTGPPGDFTLARLVRPFLELPSGLQRVLAADAAVSYSRTEHLTRGMPDDTTELRSAIRRLVTVAAEQAFDRAVDARLITVTNDGSPPVLFVRDRGSPLVLAGQLPVSWAALAMLGLSSRPGVLTAGVEVDARHGAVRAHAYSFAWRDPDLSHVELRWSFDEVRDHVRATLTG